MTEGQELRDVEEIGGLSGIQPLVGLARVRTSGRSKSSRFSVPQLALRHTTGRAGALAVSATVATILVVSAVGLSFHHPKPVAPSAPGAIVSAPTPTATSTGSPSSQVIPVTLGATTPTPKGVAPPSTRPSLAATATPSPSTPPSVDLLANSSFESPDMSQWGAWQCTISRVPYPGAPDGNYVAHVQYYTQNKGALFAIDSWAQPVAAHAGATYTASVYVAAASPQSVGKPIQLSLRESGADQGGAHVLHSVPVTLSTVFQRIQVSGTATSNDLMSAYTNTPLGTSFPGEAFYVDVFTLTAS